MLGLLACRCPGVAAVSELSVASSPATKVDALRIQRQPGLDRLCEMCRQRLLAPSQVRIDGIEQRIVRHQEAANIFFSSSPTSFLILVITAPHANVSSRAALTRFAYPG